MEKRATTHRRRANSAAVSTTLTQVVVPPLSALLATSASNGKLLDNVLGNDTPALDAKFGDQLANSLILFDYPDSSRIMQE